MNKMRRSLINFCVEYIKYNRFDGLISDVMPFYLPCEGHGWYNQFNRF